MSVSCSRVCHSLLTHGLEPTRLLYPWNSPGKNTGEGCHTLLQGIFPTQGLNPGLLHCRQILYCLSYSPSEAIKAALMFLVHIWTIKGLQTFEERLPMKGGGPSLPLPPHQSGTECRHSASSWGQISSCWASLMAQSIKDPPVMQETWVWFLGREDPLEKEMAIHSSILAWEIPWTEEPAGLQSTELQRIRQDWSDSACTPAPLYTHFIYEAMEAQRG